MTGRASAGVAKPTPTSVPARLLALHAQAGNRAVARACSPSSATTRRGRRASSSPASCSAPTEPSRTSRSTTSSARPLGYRGRRQAIGVARMAKAPHAVVVETGDGRWHALATTADFERPGHQRGEHRRHPRGARHHRPGLGRLHEARCRLRSRPGGEPEGDLHPADRDLQKRLNKVVAELEHGAFEVDTSRIAAMLGVPRDEVERITTLGTRVSDRINITGQPDVNSPGGGHAPMGGSPDFQPGVKSSLWIDLAEFDKTRAPAVMFHESEHMADWDMTQQAIADYEKAGHIFVQGQPGLAPFQAWLNEQVKKKRLTAADAEIIVDETFNRSSTTEARANVRTFLALFASGDTDAAASDLKAYANNLKPKKEGGLGHYAMPAPGSAVARRAHGRGGRERTSSCRRRCGRSTTPRSRVRSRHTERLARRAEDGEETALSHAPKPCPTAPGRTLPRIRRAPMSSEAGRRRKWHGQRIRRRQRPAPLLRDLRRRGDAAGAVARRRDDHRPHLRVPSADADATPPSDRRRFPGPWPHRRHRPGPHLRQPGERRRGAARPPRHRAHPRDRPQHGRRHGAGAGGEPIPTGCSRSCRSPPACVPRARTRTWPIRARTPPPPGCRPSRTSPTWPRRTPRWPRTRSASPTCPRGR